MTDHFDWTEPTARKRHRCWLCQRAILPGEQYRRCAALFGDSANTFKYCEHCYRVSVAWCRSFGEYEWNEDSTLEFLQDEHPALYASLQAQWRYPDGELLPFPFTKYCSCGLQIDFDAIWCIGCDQERIVRLTRQLNNLRVTA